MLTYNVVPISREGFDTSACFRSLDFDEIYQETKKLLEDASSSLGSNINQEIEASIDKESLGAITFLGTGSALPSKYRNVTSNLLEIATASGKNAMLLDSGEGCFGQLFRYVEGNRDALSTLLEKLHCVWISHNHADHHLGLGRLLSERSMKVSSPN